MADSSTVFASSCPQLSARSPRLQLHVELTAAGDRYAGYVLWGGLACPGELYREGVVEIFKTMAAEHALLPIFRDQARGREGGRGGEKRAAAAEC